MRAFAYVAAVVVAVVALGAGVGALANPPGPTGTVEGVLVRVGGPARVPVLGVPGTIRLRELASETTYLVFADSEGRFSVTVPPGTYRASAESPLVQVNGSNLTTVAAHRVVVRAGAISRVWLGLSIK